MNFVLTIDGVDRESLLRPGSLSVEQNQNGIASAACTLIQSSTGTLSVPIDRGDPFVVTDDDTGDVLFGGFVSEVNSEIVGSHTTSTYYVNHEVVAVDASHIPNRRLINAVFEGQTLLQIVTTINSSWLTSDGCTVNNVPTGPTLTKVVLPWQKVSQAFDTLSELTGFAWWIDEDKDIHFEDRVTASASSVAYSSSSRGFRSMKVRRHLRGYVNAVVQRGGHAQTGDRTEDFVGDGTRRVFNLAFPVAEKPSDISINSVAVDSADIAIRGLGSGLWYWNKGSTEIEQDASETVLTDPDTLEVTYKGLYRIFAQAEDAAQILARAAASSGTSGRYEHLMVDRAIEDLTEAADKAVGYLRRYSDLPEEIVVETDESGLAIGQLVNIVLPELNLNGDYLVDSLSMRDVRKDGVLRTRASLLSGEALGGWQRFWKERQREATDEMIDAFITDVQFENHTLEMSLTESATSQAPVYHTWGVTHYGLAEIVT